MAEVVVLDASTDRSGTHARLAAFGRYDVIVDDTLDGAGRIPALQDAFLHLRPRGVLIVRRPRREPDKTWRALSREIRRRAKQQDARSERGLAWQALPGAVDAIRIRSRHVVLRNARRAVAKMREHELDVVLSLRPHPGAAELARLPPVEFKSRCTLRQNLPARDPDMRELYHVPAMSLRTYDNVLCAPRQVAVQRNLALPDTFRFNAAEELHNRFLFDLGPLFAPVPRGGKRAKVLDGTYFYLDSEWTRHFGHAVTEQLARCWALPEAKRLFPDLRLLLDRRRPGTGIAEYELEIFGAFGFEASDFELHHRPVRVERLVAASPMWALPTHVHPDIVETWRHVGERLAAKAPAVPADPRIFLSRRRSRRGCQNLEEVETFFADHDFRVVYPEDLSLPAQVRMFREAEVIAGFAGSGMFNMQFCPTPRHVIAIGPTSYPSRNEYMICAAAGHRLDHVWSQPDPEQVRGPKPQYAGFRFDFDREGRFLMQIIDEL